MLSGLSCLFPTVNPVKPMGQAAFIARLINSHVCAAPQANEMPHVRYVD